MTQEFEKELKESLYIHRMLPCHPERSLEAEEQKKEIITWRPLVKKGELHRICAGKSVRQKVVEEGDGICIQVSAFTTENHWPEGASPDGDYSNFGSSVTEILIDGENWEEYNRLHFQVRPDVEGAEVVHLNASIENEGQIRIPDTYVREGFTTWNLRNHACNDCIWEFPSLPRDKVVRLRLYVFKCGNDTAMTGEMKYMYRDIRLERTERPAKEHGWDCEEGRIAYSTSGYLSAGKKTAVIRADSGEDKENCPQKGIAGSGDSVSHEFEVVDADTGRAVFCGKVKRCSALQGTFGVLDFSEVKSGGNYFIRTDGLQSGRFPIGREIIEEGAWKVLNFLYGERCGMPISGKHGMCHQDVAAEHQGKKMNYAGGWHDAGDVSQQTLQSGEITAALLEMAGRCRNDAPVLSERLMEEATWGLDFILRTRFGDGYRATSAGITRWTNGLSGDMDDVQARVYNHAFENFLFSGIEAYCSLALRQTDRPLADGSRKAAIEDFGFAMERFESHGADVEQIYEHTYNSGRSLYYAAIVWAAALLYQAAGEEKYKSVAETYSEKLLCCQETGETELPFAGFFYRDESRQAIVHFNHQSREHLYMQALTTACEMLPESILRPTWERAMRLYAGYLRAMWNYASPYGMMPAGVHHREEYLDAETFPYLHIQCSYEEEKENYRQQLENGISVGEHYVIRNFPVWFSFRGNTAILLSQGKAASLLGHYFGEEELLQAGREQLYWISGKNPFCQSLMYGAGDRYPSQYAILPGESVGELPVGIETKGNEDEPYWPRANNATYKEVWTSSAGRWLLLAADYWGNGS